MYYKLGLFFSLTAAVLVTGCRDHMQPPSAPPIPSVTTLATGFDAPISVESDGKGRVFVSDQGTGNNDGRILEVTPNGTVYPIVTGLYSQTNTEGDLDAPDHLLYAGGTLYLLNPKGLYKLDVASIKTGSPAIAASSLTPEDIRPFVISNTKSFSTYTGESHLYNMAMGPDGAIYIADAAANAIVRRAKTGELSIVTEVPAIKNPNPAGPPPGPPFIQAVPTGITFDGQNFMISTLLGFPFPPGLSILYKMDLAGKLTAVQQNFTSMTDVENDGNGQALVLEYGTFGAMGFAKNTGRLLRANNGSNTVILDKLNQPTDLKIIDAHTAYIASMGDKSILKLTY
ncbi:ScyD/ScyE family protein [Spirosoma koreense]